MTKSADRATRSAGEGAGRQRGGSVPPLTRALPGLDVAAAVMLSAFMVAVSAEARVVQPEDRPMTTLGAALLVLSGSALAARRVAPSLSFSLVVGASAAFLSWPWSPHGGRARAALAVVRRPGEEAAPGVADLEALLASARASGLSGKPHPDRRRDGDPAVKLLASDPDPHRREATQR